MTLAFDDGTVRRVGLSIAVTAAGGRGRSADGCAPRRLIPVPVAVAQGFSVAAGWPAPITVDLQDDCGDPVSTGSLSANFSTGEAAVPLVSLRDGRWQGTWQTRTGSTGPVTITLRGEDPERGLAGETQITAALRASQDPPAIDADGVVSTASPRPFVPAAPGALLSLFGQRFSQTPVAASARPLPTRLGETTVIMADRPVPLFSAGPDRIDVIAPFGIAPNTTHQILVRRGNTISRPVSVNVAPAQPALFPGAASGTQALATVIRGGEQFANSPVTPARASDTLVLFCSGLGVLESAFDAGAIAPSEPLLRIRDTVRVRIGGVTAPVDFAGLAPGLVGVYQLNVTVPEGVAAGSAVDLAIEVSGQTSPPATLAVE